MVKSAASVTIETAQSHNCARLLRAGKLVSDFNSFLDTSGSHVYKIKQLFEEGKDLGVVISGGPKRKK